MKIMKIVVLLIALLAMGLGTTGCSKVTNGYVGVKVKMLASEKGVQPEVVGAGRYWIGPNTELFKFPIFTQNYVWTKDPTEGSKNNEEIRFQDIEGLPITADVGISYAIDQEKVSLIFQKYRRGIDEITDVYLRNMVRDAFVMVASTRNIESIYGAGKADMVDTVERMVIEQCAPLGINIEKIYLIGNLRLPDQVLDAIDAKIAATQRAQQVENEVRESQAKAQKKIADSEGEAQSILNIANAQAQANIILAKSLTKELVEYKAIEQWDGQLPTYTGGGAVPFLNLK